MDRISTINASVNSFQLVDSRTYKVGIFVHQERKHFRMRHTVIEDKVNTIDGNPDFGHQKIPKGRDIKLLTTRIRVLDKKDGDEENNEAMLNDRKQKNERFENLKIKKIEK